MNNDLSYSTTERPQYKIPYAFIGPAGAGKTSLIKMFINNEFNSDEKSTIGSAKYNKIVTSCGLFTAHVHIVDTAGQEKYQSLTKQMLRYTSVIMCVFDVSSMDSFNKLQYFVDFAHETRGNEVVYVLVANKIDLNKDVIPESTLKEFCQNNKFDHFFRTSAKDFNSINEVFIKVTIQIIERIRDNIFVPGSSKIDVVENNHLNEDKSIKGESLVEQENNGNNSTSNSVSYYSNCC